MQYQLLLDRYLDRDVRVSEQAKIVKAILESTTLRVARARSEALSESNAGSPVVRRGRFEWHYAHPLADRAWAHLEIGRAHV